MTVAALVAAIKALDSGTILPWGSDDEQPVDDVHVGQVDIHVPHLRKLLHTTFQWMIVAPVDRVTDSAVICVPYTVTLVTGLDSNDLGAARYEVVDVSFGRHDEDVEDVVAEMVAGGRTVTVSGGWTTEVICDALQAWCAQYADRDDISFVFDDGIITPASVIAMVLLMDNVAPGYDGQGMP